MVCFTDDDDADFFSGLGDATKEAISEQMMDFCTDDLSWGDIENSISVDDTQMPAGDDRESPPLLYDPVIDTDISDDAEILGIEPAGLHPDDNLDLPSTCTPPPPSSSSLLSSEHALGRLNLCAVFNLHGLDFPEMISSAEIIASAP